MNVLQIVNEWKRGCSNACPNKYVAQECCVECTLAALQAIEQAERNRIRLEGKYTPTTLVKLSAVSLSNAVQWCMKNGQAFDVLVEHSTPMFVVARLTAVQVGLLKEIHVEGIPYNVNEAKPDHLHVDPDALDYERIG